MNSPIDLLRLTIPEPSTALPRLDSTLSVKNWSVGTLLDAIIVADQNGKLAAQIVRNGIAQQPSLPLPDYPQLKSGGNLLLKVSQMQPQVQLQIVAAPALSKTAAMLGNALATLAQSSAPAKTLTPQNQPEWAKTVVINAGLSAQEKLDLALSPRTNTTLPLPLVQTQRVLAQKIWSDNAQTLDIKNTISIASEKTKTALQVGALPLNSFRSRAEVLSQVLLPISKSIWPQQRELRAVLPALIPLLNKMTISEQDDFVAKAMQWPEPLRLSAKQLLHSIPDSTQLRTMQLDDNSDVAIPKPLRAWFRQWLQHQFNDETSTSTENDGVDRTSTSTAKTPQQLLSLIRQILVGDSEPLDPEVSVTLKTNKTTAEPLKTEEAVTAQQKTMTPRTETTDKNANAISQTELIELESLLQTVVARLQHQTLNQLQSEARGTPQWTAELPVLFQQRLDVFDLMIEADQQNYATHTTEVTMQHYVIRLRFDLAELGPCQFIVQLRGSEVDINVYSERENTQIQFAQSFEVLAQWLSLDHLHLNASDSFTIANLTERMR